MSKILVVDDNDVSRGILLYQFYDFYEMIEAENGKEALQKLKEHNDIVAVLLDLIMPEMDGIQVLSQMKENGYLERIPVFVITADRDEKTLAEAFDLGAVDVITKPINANFIRNRVRNIIELYDHRNSLEDRVDNYKQKVEAFNTELAQSLSALLEEQKTNPASAANSAKSIAKKMCEFYPECGLPNPELRAVLNECLPIITKNL